MQQRFAVSREFDQDLSLIFMAVSSTYRAALHQPVYEFNRAVVTKTELLRKRSNGWAGTLRQSFDSQEHLVLLRLDSLGASCFFAEVQKLPDPVTELGKAPKAKFRYIRSGRFGEVGVLTVTHQKRTLLTKAYHFRCGAPFIRLFAQSAEAHSGSILEVMMKQEVT
jgi:hypothetical protein